MYGHRLILDSMCGKLARWLRFLGIDALYVKDAHDDEIVLIAQQDDRILVTRDHALHDKATKKGIKSILLDSTDHVKNMTKILKELGIEIVLPPKTTRCPICNALLKEVHPLEVLDLLPSKDLAHRYERFWFCEKCKKVYWIGSHWKNIKKILSKIEENIKKGVG